MVYFFSDDSDISGSGYYDDEQNVYVNDDDDDDSSADFTNATTVTAATTCKCTIMSYSLMPLMHNSLRLCFLKKELEQLSLLSHWYESIKIKSSLPHRIPLARPSK